MLFSLGEEEMVMILSTSLLNTSDSVPYSCMGAAAAAGCAMIFIWGAGCARGGRGSMLTLMATACCTKWR